MPRKRGPSTRSSARRRKARQTKKYTWKVVPVLYKKQLDTSTLAVEDWLLIQDELEIQSIEELEDHSVSSDEHPHYLAFARSLLSKCLNFTSTTYSCEQTSLRTEFILRGKQQTVLDALIVVVDDLCEVIRYLVTVRELLTQILEDIGVMHFRSHSRTRVYPQNVTLAPTLTALAAADTFGPWAEIIPLNTIPFPFHVIGICVCEVSAVGNYHFQLGYNTVVADPPANYEMGERRIRFADHPIARQSELLEIRGQGIPANSRVMGRLKTASGNADTATVNVVVTRHLEISDEPDLYPSFPW
ncbi:hypothetical protein ES703_02131 [subsurface metagenome]